MLASKIRSVRNKTTMNMSSCNYTEHEWKQYDS